MVVAPDMVMERLCVTLLWAIRIQVNMPSYMCLLRRRLYLSRPKVGFELKTNAQQNSR